MAIDGVPRGVDQQRVFLARLSQVSYGLASKEGGNAMRHAVNLLGRLGGLGITVLLGGCVPGIISSGHDFDMARAQALQPGVATLATAKAQVGEPYSIETNADGTTLVKWVYAANGVVGVHGKGIAILFGADGKMIRVTKLKSDS